MKEDLGFPPEIELCGVVYKIKRVPNFKDCGECLTTTKEIFINSDQHYENQLTTFYHELTHAYLYEAGMGSRFEEDEEEDLCELVAAIAKEFARAGA